MYSTDWWSVNDRLGNNKRRRITKEHAVEQQNDTATEHAVEQQSDTATEHIGNNRRQKEEAQADRADNTMDNLSFKLLEFLVDVLREAWTVPSGRPCPRDTGQTASSGSTKEEISSDMIWDILKETNSDDMVLEDQCEDIVFEKIAEWAGRYSESPFYSEQELVIHKKMFDIMTRDKDGLPKENVFIDWCRRVNTHSEPDSSTATEHTASKFKALAFDIFSNDLTPQQLQSDKFRIRKDKALTTPQRSVINAILRKNLGNPRVAYYIFNHGLPTLLDLPLRRKTPTKALLQNMLEEFMIWHASLLQSIHDQQQHPDMIEAHKLSALDQKPWQKQRRQRRYEARQRLNQGTCLTRARDSGKRKIEHMSATEQQVLHDFETHKFRRQHEEAGAKRMPWFQGKKLKRSATTSPSATDTQ
jgi:hypothetical protein